MWDFVDACLGWAYFCHAKILGILVHSFVFATSFVARISRPLASCILEQQRARQSSSGWRVTR